MIQAICSSGSEVVFLFLQPFRHDCRSNSLSLVRCPMKRNQDRDPLVGAQDKSARSSGPTTVRPDACFLLLWGGKEILFYTLALLVMMSYGFQSHFLISYTLGILEGVVVIVAGIYAFRRHCRFAALLLKLAGLLRLASSIAPMIQERAFSFSLSLFAEGLGYGVVLFLVSLWLGRQEVVKD